MHQTTQGLVVIIHTQDCIGERFANVQNPILSRDWRGALERNRHQRQGRIVCAHSIANDHANRLRPDPPVRIVLPSSEHELNQKPSQKIQVTSLCKSIQDVASSPIHFSVEKGALYQYDVEDAANTKSMSQGTSTSLSDGLLENESILGPKAKICLATVLSYSLLDFCGEPWFPGGWTRDGIYLLRYGQRLSLRPALIARVAQEATAPTSSIMNDVRLLYHGILLMEIFRQEALPIDLCRSKEMSVDDLREFARKEFASMEESWDVCERYKQSVEACIEGMVLGDESEDEEAFAAAFCQNVIDPLETDYMSLWENKDLDEVVSELQMPIVKPPPRAPKPAQLQVSHRS